MAETVTAALRRGAAVELGVELVSAHGRALRLVWGDLPPPPVTLPELREELTRRDYSAPIVLRKELPADAWVDVGSAQLRFSFDLHEGDASFEYRGKFEIRCEPDAPAIEIPFDEDPGGPRAVVAAAADTPLVAVTIEHQDGGEGSVDVRWNSRVIDRAQWCPWPAEAENENGP